MKQDRALKTAAVYEQARQEKGLKDIQVARQAGVTTSLICDWKKGRYTPKIDKLQRVAKALDIPVTCFLDD